jgi:hypothetical protein
VTSVKQVLQFHHRCLVFLLTFLSCFFCFVLIFFKCVQLSLVLLAFGFQHSTTLLLVIT